MVDPGEKLVAIVDDDAPVRSALLGLTEAAELHMVAFPSAEKHLESGMQQTGCIVADIRMPGMSGLNLQAWLSTHCSGVSVLFITAHGYASTRARALNAGAPGLLEKHSTMRNCSSASERH